MWEYKINIPRLKISKRLHGTPSQFLRKEAVRNAEERGLLRSEDRDKYLQRIDHEIEVFERCGYVDYLIGVSRLVNMMNFKGIHYIAGRGELSASLVFYCLDITSVNPIEPNLSFTRFMSEDNPQFVEIELLINDQMLWEIKDLQEITMALYEPEGHCVTLRLPN